MNSGLLELIEFEEEALIVLLWYKTQFRRDQQNWFVAIFKLADQLCVLTWKIIIQTKLPLFPKQ